MEKTSLGFDLFQPEDDFKITGRENSLNSNTKKINDAIEKVGKDSQKTLDDFKKEIGEDIKQKVENNEKTIEEMKSGTVELPFRLEVKEKFFQNLSVPENNSIQQNITLTKEESDRFLFAFANLEQGRTGHLVNVNLSKTLYDGVTNLAMSVGGLTATNVSVRVYIVFKK